jgi:glycosyltransferase involved in cell wall biosynthesis
MRILSLTAGAGGMYCGSCLRDNAMAAELLARGHDVTLLPLYTPLLTDEANVSRPRVLFGGISIYLQQRSGIFRRTPRFVDRILDAPRVIRAFADRSVSVDARLLGDLTIAMLDGAAGVLRKEFDKLLDWTRSEPLPDVVNITNSMLIGLARPLRDALRRPICCTLQGEDLFLENLSEPYRSRAVALIREQVPHVDRFIAVSEYYAGFMSRYLQIPADRMSVVPLGINLNGYEDDLDGGPPQGEGGPPKGGPHVRDGGPHVREDGLHVRASDEPFRVGYFARVAPEKGLQLLADAFIRLKQRTGDAPVRLEAAGYMAASDKKYLETVRQSVARAGFAADFTYHGTVNRRAKLAFLRRLDVVSVPAIYDEPKGFSLLEAMASGVPVVQPRRGSFTEIVERTGGGLLVEPDDAESLAGGLFALFHDRNRRLELGRRGKEGVRRHYSIQRSVDRLVDVYEALVHPPSAESGASKGRVAHAP